jgi:uncharacterized membrane protein
MNGAQLHLALNHIPVILSSVALLLTLWGWLRKNPEIKKVGLVLIVGTAVFAGVAFLTGEPAEDVIKSLPSFSEPHVEEHEKAGTAALTVSIIAGVAALASFMLAKRKPLLSHYALILTILFSLMASTAFLRTAHLGGLIHHEEIRPK